jgi:3-deoxy-D-manno-octulosonic-acid transferase
VPRALYSLAFCLLLPPILLYFLWRSLREPGYRLRWGERFGFGSAPTPGGIWLHAASVGEVQAARPLVESLLNRYPQHALTVSCITPAGARRARELWAGRVSVCYLPFDTPGAVARFLGRVQPRLALVLETEIWPNLYAACAARGIPLLIVSARLSEGALARFSRFPGAALLRATLRGVAGILAQSEADAERYRRAGAPAARVEVMGNLKFDHRLDPALPGHAQVLREDWGATRPVWIAASTHEGEEAVVLDAHARLRQRLPDLLLVLAPRHPPRFERVAELCAAAGFATARRSRGEIGDPDTAVVLVDTIGELNLFYAAADVAFVGGSLVPVGGHNLLEPAALGLPILVGPHMHNQPEMTELLLSAGAARQVADVYELVQAVDECLESPALRHQAGAAARHVMERNRGSLARVLARVAALLEEPASPAGAARA